MRSLPHHFVLASDSWAKCCPILFSPFTTDGTKHNSLQSMPLFCGMSAVEGKCCSLLSDSSVVPCNKDVTATLFFCFFFVLV